jgi:acetyl-CoA carboxylase carboxyl transferase subunit alpha
LIDGIIPEPAGGAHWNYDQAAQQLKDFLVPVLRTLRTIPAEQRVQDRIEKFGRIGFWEE